MDAVDYKIEIATSDYATTKAAVEGGADRIELCANLAEGGTTASYGHIRQCREAFTIDIYPIIRSRGGDFLYTNDEFNIMLRDAVLCRELGCDGIVIGFLNTDGSVDIRKTAAIVEAAYPLGVTFHRAFDRCLDPIKAMEQLIEIGCERILTSGQRETAPEGVELIAELNKQADGRIVIMPGSGVRKENIAELAARTGCTEFHSSLRSTRKSEMEFVHEAFADSADSYTNNYIDSVEVRSLRESLANKFV